MGSSRRRKSPTPKVRHEMGGGVFTAELRRIRTRLGLACSTAVVVGHALRDQSAELDGDAADVLRRHVSDVLFVQMQEINRLLGEDDGREGGDPENKGAS